MLPGASAGPALYSSDFRSKCCHLSQGSWSKSCRFWINPSRGEFFIRVCHPPINITNKQVRKTKHHFSHKLLTWNLTGVQFQKIICWWFPELAELALGVLSFKPLKTGDVKQKTLKRDMILANPDDSYLHLRNLQTVPGTVLGHWFIWTLYWDSFLQMCHLLFPWSNIDTKTTFCEKRVAKSILIINVYMHSMSYKAEANHFQYPFVKFPGCITSARTTNIYKLH